MKRSAPPAVLAGLLVWTAAATAQEAVTIKLKELRQGESAAVERTETTTLVQKTTDAKGKELKNQTVTITETAAFKETVLERAGNKDATKIEREYTAAQVKVGTETRNLPYKGKTVVIEKKGEQYTFSYKGGDPLKDEDAESLAREFKGGGTERAELEKLLLPPGAVKAGAEWKLDMAAVVKEMMKGEDVALDPDKATGSGKLAKVYQKDGKTFGELSYKLTVPVKSLGKGKQQLKFEAGAASVLEGTQDVCIDGTAATGVSKSKAHLKGTAPQPNDETLTLSITVESQETRKELPKK
jgi:hypothetical protein